MAWKLIVGRWIEIVALGLVSGIAASFLSSIVELWSISISTMPPPWAVWSAITASAFAIAMRVSTFRSFIPFTRPCFPGVVDAVVIGIVILCVTKGITPWTCIGDWSEHCTIVVQLAIALGAGALIGYPMQRLYTPRATTKSSFDAWVDNDQPTAEDRFQEHSLIADRIASRLTAGDASASIALVGSFGSGKSTVLELVTARLRSSTPKVRIVSLSTWPYESSMSVIRGILTALITTIDEHASTISLAGLPERYVRAVSGLGGGAQVIAALMDSRKSTDEILKRISKRCRATGIRLVLWIEDLERFSPDPANYAPVRALLHSVNELEGIDVVIASESLDARIDPEKIVRFIETIPALTPDQVLPELAQLAHLLPGERDVIVPEGERSELGSPYDRTYRRVFVSSGHIHMLNEAAATLLQTPRKLKMALRLVRDTRRSLPGELPLDPMLAAACLKVGTPHLYAAAQGSREDRASRPSTNDAVPQALEHFDKTLHALTPNKRHAARFLLQTMEGRPSALGDSESTVPRHFGQTTSNGGHVDYWRRFDAVIVPKDGDGDQDALKAIQDYDRDPENLVSRIISGTREGDVDRTLQAINLLGARDDSFWLDIFIRVVHATAELPPEIREYSSSRIEATQNRYYGVSCILHRRWLFDGTKAQQWIQSDLVDLIARVSKLDLGVAHELVDRFLGPDNENRIRANGSGSEAVNAEVAENLRKQATKRVCEALAGASCEELVRSLRPGTAHELLHVTFGLPEIRRWRDTRPERPPTVPGWEALAPRLIDAIVLAPDVVVPAVAAMVVWRSGGSFDRRPVESSVRETFVDELFDRPKLIAALRGVDIAFGDDDAGLRAQTLIEWASEYSPAHDGS